MIKMFFHKKNPSTKVRPSLSSGLVFWINAGAFLGGLLMVGLGLVAAHAQMSTESLTPAASDSPQVSSSTPPAMPEAVNAKASEPAATGGAVMKAPEPASINASSPAQSQADRAGDLKARVQAASAPAARKRKAVIRQPLTLPKITLYQGEVRVIRQPKVNRIAVGNGALVKTTVVDDRQIVLVAEGAGDTTVHLWYVGGIEARFDVQVQPVKVSSALDEVRALLKPYSSVTARTSGKHVVIEGAYPNADGVLKIKAIADRFQGVVVNLIPDAPTETVTVHPEPMIHLDLKVVEVRKNALDQLGIRWANTAQGPRFATAANIFSNARFPNMVESGYPIVNSNRPVVAALGLATQVSSMLNFLEQNGDSWTLAEPRLSCQSGGVSEFVAGGEIPIPVATGFGQVDVTYKQYGVVIKFKPKADLKDNISSEISVEVSQPDPGNSLNGFVAFTTNRTMTEVNMRPNVPLVISGLLRTANSKALQGVPGLSKLPIIGGLFRDREDRGEQTELLVVVVPRIIRPSSNEDAEVIKRVNDRAQSIKKTFADRIAD